MYHFSAVPYLRMNSLHCTSGFYAALRSWMRSQLSLGPLSTRAQRCVTERVGQDWTVGINIPLLHFCLTWHLRALCYKPKINCIRRVIYVYMECISVMEHSSWRMLQFVSCYGKQCKRRLMQDFRFVVALVLLQVQVI